MDAWHRIGRIIRLSNLGTLIFFLLNISLLYFIFFPYGITPENAFLMLALYVITVLISFSPVGEWVLATFAGAKEIKRRDIKIRLIPLLEVVFEQAKEKTPSMVSSIHLMMNTIVDRFGDDVVTRKTDDQHFVAEVEVFVSPTFFSWIFAYNGAIRITSPQDVMNEYKKKVSETLKRL